MSKQVMDAEGVAEYLGLHPETVRRFAREGKVPAYKIGGTWRFKRDAIDLWAESQRFGAKKQQVLIIEDDSAILNILTRTLEGAGFQVAAAATGAEAVAQYREGGADAIILDLKLPDMTGADVLARIAPAAKDVPVLLMTGYPDSEMVMQAIENGPVVLLAKPTPPDRVLALVQTFLKK